MKLDIQLFAEGSVTVVGAFSGSSGAYAKFYATRSYTQNDNNLTTTETITIYIQRVSSYTYAYQLSTPLIIKADNTTLFSGNVSFDLRNVAVGTSVLLKQITRTLQHSNDGTYPSYTLSSTLTTGTSLGTGTLSGSITTPTIQTSFIVASNDFNINNTVPIFVGVNRPDYTYNLRYEIGTRTGTIASNQNIGTYVWEMPSSLITQIKNDNPTNARVNVKIYCDTYDGSTLKGTKDTTVIGTIIDKPVDPITTHNELNTKVAQLTSSNYVVKNISRLKFTFPTTSPTGTTIAKYVVYVGDRTIESSTNEVIVENIIENVNNVTTFAYETIDSRGNHSDILIQDIPFINYDRCEYINTTSTLERDNLTTVIANLKANWYNGRIGTTNNVLTLGYKYREKGTSSYITGTTTITASDLGTDKTIATLDNTKNYEFVFTIKDLIYDGSDMNKTLASSEYVMCEYENGVDFKNAWIKGVQIATMNDIGTKSKMTIGLSANATHTSTTKVALNTVMNSVGNKFTLNSNGIRIGAGVTKVKVSGNILQRTTAINLYGGYITKNGTALANAVNIGFNTVTNANTWAFFHTSMAPMIIDVVEGDIIYLCSYVGTSSTVTLQAYDGRAINLTVEEI